MLRFRFSSIRVRLILLVLLATVPALGLMLYNAMDEQRAAAVAAQNEALRLAHLIAEDHRELIEETRGLLIAMAQHPSVQNQDSSQCNEFFDTLLKHYHSDYTNFVALDTDGQTFCSANPIREPFNAIHALWFHQALQSHDFSLSEYHIGGASGQPQFNVAYTATGQDGRARALVLAGLNLGRIKPFIAKVQLPAGSVAALINAEGTILVRYPEMKEFAGDFFSKVPLLRSALVDQREGHIESSGADGISRLYAFSRVGVAPPNRDVTVVVGIPTAVVFAQARWAMDRNLLLLGLVVLLAIAVAWFGGNFSIVNPVSSLALATERLAGGNLTVRTGPPYQDGEVGALQESFDKMAEALQERNTEAKLAEEELRQSREQLRHLATHLQTVREEERTRISREIHDGLGQDLTGLKMDLSRLARARYQIQNSSAHTWLRENIKSMLDIVDGIIQKVRTISTELRPGVLDYLGLAAAIEWQVQEFRKRARTQCKWTLKLEDIPMKDSCSTAMFRIFQEALTNIARHAHATRISINLEKRDGYAILRITDNGIGINEGKLFHPKSLGLLGMRERAHLLGGDVRIERNTGQGTTVIVRMPVEVAVSGAA